MLSCFINGAPRSASKLSIDPINGHTSYFRKSIGSNKRSVPIKTIVASNWNQRVHLIYTSGQIQTLYASVRCWRLLSFDKHHRRQGIGCCLRIWNRQDSLCYLKKSYKNESHIDWRVKNRVTYLLHKKDSHFFLNSFLLFSGSGKLWQVKFK